MQPSARYHVFAGLVTPMDSCPSIFMSQYSDLSQTIQDSLSLQDDHLPDGRGGGIRKAVPDDAVENPPHGECMREGTGLEIVKDGIRKQGGFKCGMTISRQRENTRLGGNMKGSVGKHAMVCGQPRRKGWNRTRIPALEAAYEGYRFVLLNSRLSASPISPR